MLLGASLCGCSYVPWFGADEEQAAAGARERPTIAVDVEGVEGALANNVRAHLALAAKACDTAPAYLRALGARAEQEALEALRAFGYYDARAQVELDRDGTCPSARVTIERGARVRLREIDIDVRGAGADDPGFARALDELPLTPGQGLNHQRYSDAKARIESVALQRGYLEGRFVTSELRVDAAAGAADVVLHYDSGPRYTTGELRIRQEPETLEEGLVRRLLDHETGVPYTAGRVTRYYSALSASEYFGVVEVRPLIATPEDHRIPLEVRLTPRLQHKYSAGIGASTDEGIRGRASYTNRRVNRRGHRFHAELRASLIEQRLSAAYRIPREHPADEWLSVQGGLRRQHLDTFDTLESQFGVAETKRRPWDWMETRFVNLNHQKFDIGGDSRSTTLLIPGLRWTRTRVDDPLYPRRGYAVDFEVRGAAETLVSDVRFLRTLLTLDAVYGLPAGLRLLTRGEAGATLVGDFDVLPPSERFFAGGDTSIRGYDFRDLGPEDDAGRVVGGRYLAVGSLEIEKALTDAWGVAGFVDAGNAFGGSGSGTGIKIGVGLGARWRSPIGPARVDLAHPLDSDTLVRLHLRIGPDL